MNIILQLTVGLLGCFFTIQPCATENTKCAPIKLNPDQKLLITIFDNNYEAGGDEKLWDILCRAIIYFRQGLITMEYRPGALAEGSIGNLSCPGSGDCISDLYYGCEVLNDKNVNDCFATADESDEMFIKEINCFCKRESSQFILDNAKLRASLNIPEKSIPALAFNNVYDPCATIKSVLEILSYLCSIYQNKVSPCG